MLIVDILHEFELGVWKALFIHLLRILEAKDPNLLCELNRRYENLVTCLIYLIPALDIDKFRHLVETPLGDFPLAYLK